MSSSEIFESSGVLKKKFRRVLLVMTDHHLGDFVISLPTLQALARHFDAPVDAIVDARYASLARLLPDFDTVIPYRQDNRRRNRWRQALDFIAISRRLLSGRYDLAIDVGGGIQAVTLTTLTLARHRIGRDATRRCRAYSHRLLMPPCKHRSEYFAMFTRAIGNEATMPVHLHAPAGAIAQLDQKLSAMFGRVPERIAVIHPGAGYAFRKWPGERFVAVADHLASYWDMHTVFIGAPGEEEFLNSLKLKMKNPGWGATLAVELTVILALFNRAKILISNESGPTHLAAATEVNIVTIFGPSDETIWRPTRTEKIAVLRGRVCPPECKWGDCKHALACIHELSVDHVIESVAAQLRQAKINPP